jgi:lactoylglutathione lyase
MTANNTHHDTQNMQTNSMLTPASHLINEAPIRLLHTMLRVSDLDKSINFYTEKLGMRVFRKEAYPSGRFTLAFVGYAAESAGAMIELTHNWDVSEYQRGNAYGHIALAVRDLTATCLSLALAGVKILRPPGPMNAISPDRDRSENIAFIEDPDGYQIELIETPLLVTSQ